MVRETLPCENSSFKRRLSVRKEQRTDVCSLVTVVVIRLLRSELDDTWGASHEEFMLPKSCGWFVLVSLFAMMQPWILGSLTLWLLYWSSLHCRASCFSLE